MIRDTPYIRKCFSFEFEDGQDEIEIDDNLNLAAFRDYEALDHLVYEIDRWANEKKPKFPDRSEFPAYIDLSVGTFYCEKDEFSRLKEIQFEIFDESVKEFLLEMIDIERDELIKMQIPDIFIPFSFYISDCNLGKMKGFTLSHFEGEFDDFEIFSKKDREEDSDLKIETKETRRLLPFVFYSAQQLYIRAQRGEPILILDEKNEIISHDWETEFLDQSPISLTAIRKAHPVKKRYFRDGSQMTWMEENTSKIAHVIFEADEGGEKSIDLFCKMNESGFMSAGHFAFGRVCTNNESIPFQIDRTGFVKANNELLKDFWWSNIFGCKMEEGAKCAYWSKNFKKSTGLNMSFLDISS